MIIDGYAVDEPNYLATIQNDVLSVMNHYSRFLHDGDYERFQPYTDWKGLINIEDEKELARCAWLLNRFTKYGSKEWYELHKLFCSYLHIPVPPKDIFP